MDLANSFNSTYLINDDCVRAKAFLSKFVCDCRPLSTTSRNDNLGFTGQIWTGRINAAAKLQPIPVMQARLFVKRPQFISKALE